MNGNTIRALGMDALYQVLDNSVFRILAGFTAVPVLFTLLFGFRESEVVFLFGLESWSYDGILKFLASFTGRPPADLADAQGAVISALLSLVFDYIVGWFGVLFCIAATAFFVPAMIEKGADNVLFHKSVSRLTLFLARYFSGLLFIGLLSLLLVGGMQVSLLVVSGYNDPGIIFGAFQLVYVFGAIYAVCMLVGILTRSTVASILLTTLFFMFNGCIHGTWAAIEQGSTMQTEEQEKLALLAEERGEAAAALDTGVDTAHPLAVLLRRTLNGMHYTLPKTSDAPILARKLRKSVDPTFYRDDETALALFALPSDWSEDPSGPEPTLALESHELGTPMFRISNDDAGAHAVLFRREAVVETRSVNGKTVERTERVSRTAADVETELEAIADVRDSSKKSVRFGENAKGQPIFGASRLVWSHGEGPEARGRALVLFKLDNRLFYTLLLEVPDPGLAESLLEELNSSMALDKGTQATWYEKQLSLDAPWRYNILFSVGSTVAFTVLVLALGWWRLTRIEF